MGQAFKERSKTLKVEGWDAIQIVINRKEGPDHPREFLTGKKPVREPLLYCGLCNTYARYHEHDCNNDSPWDPYNGYPSDAPDTD